MNESIQRYFQVGVVAAMAFPSYREDAVAAVRKIAADAYLGAVELNPIADPDQRTECRRLLEQTHMTVCYGAHGRLLSAGLNPNDLNEAHRLAAQNALFAGVDEAVELGAKSMAFLAGRWEPDTREQALEQLCRTTALVCAYGQSKGIRIELEVFDHDIDKRALIGPAPLAARFAAKVLKQTGNFGLMVDLSHIPMTYETPAFVLRTLRPYITHFHVGNTVIRDRANDAYGDEHPRFGYPGSENDTSQLLEFLKAAKAEGFLREDAPMVLSFEVKPRPGEDPVAVLAGAKRVLNRAWALL